jgi:hypothetical protein
MRVVVSLEDEMRRVGFGLLALAMGGCEPEIGIYDDSKFLGVPNPPAIENPSKHDRIVQVTTPKVDVLWVVDNSCSMIEEQVKLTSNFAQFIEFFVDSGLDWHIGVTSTDTDSNAGQGRLQGTAGYRFLDSNSPDPIGLFQQMASLGTNGAVDERGRRATKMALTDPQLSGYNAGFYREEASLNVIVISDENDYSASNPTRNEFIDFLTNLKDDPELVTFSSIVGPQSGCSSSTGDAEPGTEYIAVTNAVGGIHESICVDDWVPVLEDLGLQAAGLRREYFLSELPVPGTLEVWVVDESYVYDGVDQALLADGSSIASHCPSQGCFTYEYSEARNSILMEEYVPSPLAEINIRYDLLSGFQPDEDGVNPLAGVVVDDTDQ